MLNSQLRHLGDPGFSDTVIMLMLLGSLPQAYDHFITAYVASNIQTLEYCLEQRLLDQVRQIWKRVEELVHTELHALFVQRSSGAHKTSTNYLERKSHELVGVHQHHGHICHLNNDNN